MSCIAITVFASVHLTLALCPVHIPEKVLIAARIISGFLVLISSISKLMPLFWKILSAPASSLARTIKLFAAFRGGLRRKLYWKKLLYNLAINVYLFDLQCTVHTAYVYHWPKPKYLFEKKKKKKHISS